MNWIIIERYINTMWQTFIENKGYLGARKKFLEEDTRTWTVAIRLEVLNVIGDLNDDEYQIINRFRKARNKFARGKEIINEDLSKNC